MEKTTPESSSLGSLSDIKEKATEGAISFWTREQCVSSIIYFTHYVFYRLKI